MMGMAGSSNVQGEDQKKLDLLSNEVFKNSLRRSGQCCILVRRGWALDGCCAAVYRIGSRLHRCTLPPPEGDRAAPNPSLLACH